jgi:hypothetical protein
MRRRRTRRRLTARRVLGCVVAAEVVVGMAWFAACYVEGHAPTGLTRDLLGAGIIAPVLVGHTLTQLRLLRESIGLSLACSLASMVLLLASAYLATMAGLLLAAGAVLCAADPPVLGETASVVTLLDVGGRLGARCRRALR